MAYDEQFLTGIEWMWGEGFMSPGGAAEVAEILSGVDLHDRHVLDIGCGIGGVDFLLLETHGAERVTGIDVEPELLARAEADAQRRGLNGRLALVLVEPGPLPFPAAAFDLVFSKDSIIHVPDKRALFHEVYRVLRPGGMFVASDWLGRGTPPSPAMQAWLDIVQLDFALVAAADIEVDLSAAGFTGCELRDRNEWYRGVVREELASLSGDNQQRLAARIGSEAATRRLVSTTAKLEVVDGGELRPTHIRARKV